MLFMLCHSQGCLLHVCLQGQSPIAGCCWCIPISLSLWACSHGNCDKYTTAPSETNPRGSKFILMKLAWSQRNLGDFWLLSTVLPLTWSWRWRSSKWSCLRYGLRPGSWDLGQAEKGRGKMLLGLLLLWRKQKVLYPRSHGLWALCEFWEYVEWV